MKKQSFLFIAGALITLASCQNNTTDPAAEQAKIDSAVNARLEEIRTQMMMQNDSIINAEAQRRADSMFAAAKASGTTGAAARSSATRRNTGNPPAPAPATSPGRNNTPAPTGKTTDNQGTPTGKTTTTQQQEGRPTGKQR